MSKQVILTRKRTIEEKIVSTVSTADKEDAVAITHHLMEDHSLDWQYNRTLETSEEEVEVKEVNPK